MRFLRHNLFPLNEVLAYYHYKVFLTRKAEFSKTNIVFLFIFLEASVIRGHQLALNIDHLRSSSQSHGFEMKLSSTSGYSGMKVILPRSVTENFKNEEAKLIALMESPLSSPKKPRSQQSGKILCFFVLLEMEVFLAF